MTTPSVKRVERSPSFSEVPKALEPDDKKRAIEQGLVVPTPVPFPGLLDVQNGIAAMANPPRTIDIETFLDMIQRKALPNFAPVMSAQMAVEFFATEAVSALATRQSKPICPSFVQSYFKWEAAAAEHVTGLSYDINLDSDMAITHSESALLRFLPLCTNLRVLQLNISGCYADGAVMLSSVDSVLEKLPAQVNEIGLFLNLKDCLGDQADEIAPIFYPLMSSLLSKQQLIAVEFSFIGGVDLDTLLDSDQIPKIMCMYPRPFQLKILTREPDELKSDLYQYKYIQGQEWQECAELYNEMIADPEQAQVFSLRIVNKLFPESVQSALRCISIEGQNGELSSWLQDNPLPEVVPIDPAVDQGVIWCDSQFLPSNRVLSAHEFLVVKNSFKVNLLAKCRLILFINQHH